MRIEPHRLPRQRLLIGRADDVARLASLAERHLITVVIGAPRMGKTWLAEEVCSVLSGSDLLVGYHEARGFGGLVRAVHDLYLRWLSDASATEQLKVLLARQESGTAFLSGLLEGSAGIANSAGLDLVAQLFKGLRSAATSERNPLGLEVCGGELALRLATVCSEVSGRRCLVVLDAWECSSELRAEAMQLCWLASRAAEAHPGLHLVVIAQEGGEAAELARNLGRLPSVAVYQLPEFRPTLPELTSALAPLRHEQRLPSGLTDEELWESLGGYPGVLERWKHLPAGASPSDVKRASLDAKRDRYRELDVLCTESLAADLVRFGTRLALFPRFHLEGWERFRSVLEAGLGNDVAMRFCESPLFDASFHLENEPGARYPHYGHEARHMAAIATLLSSSKRRLLVREEARFLAIALGELAADGLKLEHREAMVPLAHIGRLNVLTEPALRTIALGTQVLLGPSESGLDLARLADIPESFPRLLPLASAISCLACLAGIAAPIEVFAGLASRLPVDEQLRLALTQAMLLADDGEQRESRTVMATALALDGGAAHLRSALRTRLGGLMVQANEAEAAVGELALDWPPASAPKQQSQRLLVRALALGASGDTSGEREALHSVLVLPGAAPEHVRQAVFALATFPRQNVEGTAVQTDRLRALAEDAEADLLTRALASHWLARASLAEYNLGAAVERASQASVICAHWLRENGPHSAKAEQLDQLAESIRIDSLKLAVVAAHRLENAETTNMPLLRAAAGALDECLRAGVPAPVEAAVSARSAGLKARLETTP